MKEVEDEFYLILPTKGGEKTKGRHKFLEEACEGRISYLEGIEVCKDRGLDQGK